MKTISLFTSISYSRQKTCAEGALSTLSHFFYLGGKRARVIKGDAVNLETGKIFRGSVALKVAAYILLFPLTLTLLAIHLSLRCRHNFTVIKALRPEKKQIQKPNSLQLPKEPDTASANPSKQVLAPLNPQVLEKSPELSIPKKKPAVSTDSLKNTKHVNIKPLTTARETIQNLTNGGQQASTPLEETIQGQAAVLNKDPEVHPEKSKETAPSSAEEITQNVGNGSQQAPKPLEETIQRQPAVLNKDFDVSLEIPQEKSKETPQSATAKIAQNVDTIGQQALMPSKEIVHNQLPAAKEKSSQPVSLSQESKKNAPISLEAFHIKLAKFWVHNRNVSEIAKELFENIPENLELNDIVSFVFNHCQLLSILSILDAIPIAYPAFTLSPYDKIRRLIVEDKQHALSNHSLMNMLKELGLDRDERKISDCYDLAYRLNHPYIYPISKIPVPTSDYNLNFLWVNLNPQDRIQNMAQNIFKDGLNTAENDNSIKDPKSLRALEKKEVSLENRDLEKWKQIKESFTYKISRWADIHPGARINLWYDSALVTQQAQQKTFEMMKSISESRGVNLKLKDIRQLPIITTEIKDSPNETKNSLHPGTQLYYRVDLLKALIADHMMSSAEEKYSVVLDIDVEPMTSQQMFDQRTLDYLSTNGYVFDRGSGRFENSFFIFNKEKNDLQQIHREAIIDEAEFNIKDLRNFQLDARIHEHLILGAESIFKLYESFRNMVGEKRDRPPRKAVKCPPSQFDHGKKFSNSDYQMETFRFIGESNIPYTKFGRNYAAFGYDEGQIKELIDWKAEPLVPIE